MFDRLVEEHTTQFKLRQRILSYLRMKRQEWYDDLKDLTLPQFNQHWKIMRQLYKSQVEEAEILLSTRRSNIYNVRVLVVSRFERELSQSMQNAFDEYRSAIASLQGVWFNVTEAIEHIRPVWEELLRESSSATAAAANNEERSMKAREILL